MNQGDLTFRKQSRRTLQRFPGIQVGTLAAVLLFSSSISLAKEAPADSVHFSEWKALGSGYLARRRVPPNVELPVSERRLATTQLPGAELEAKNPSKWKSTINAQPNGLATSDDDSSIETVWLRTKAEGLYSVSIADLAAQLGQRTKDVTKWAGKGKLSLTNAGDGVAWHYEPKTETFFFVAEPYETFYSDENAYALIDESDDARPMQLAKGKPVQALGAETPFPETLTFEEEPDLKFSVWAVGSDVDADFWFWDYLYGGYKKSIEVPLNIPHPASEGTAQLRITMRGFTELEQGDEHHVYAVLNDEELHLQGSHMLGGHRVVSWDGFDEKVLVADLSQNLLDPAGNNNLELRSVYPDGEHPGQFLDQVEIDYSRLPTAVGGSLWMHDVAAGIQKVTGLASENIMVIESPTGDAILREDLRVEADGAGGWSVTFETSEGADYLVAGKNAVKSPILASARDPGLTKTKNRADYLIIAPRKFNGTATALAKHRGDHFSFVKTVWLDDIYNTFSAGRVDPSAITRFMTLVEQKWKVSPSHVVLIGKGTVDHKDRMGYGDSFVPVLMTSTPWALAASDDRLLDAGIDSSFAIGRLPITNDTEGMAYVDKLVAYESTAPGSEYYEAVVVADNPDLAGDFHANSDYLANQLLDTLGFDQVTLLYHPDDSVRANLTQSDTWESGYVIYDGHGSATQVGDGSENFINANDADELFNDTHPIFTALTCASGDFSFPGVRSLASALVLNPNGGAIATLAPTGLSLDADAHLLGTTFADSLFLHDKTVGEALLEAKQLTHGVVAEFMPGIYSIIGEPGIYAH